MANGRTRGPNAAVYWPDMVEQLKRLAAAENCTPAQLALAWVLSRGPISCRSQAPVLGRLPVRRKSARYRMAKDFATWPGGHR